MKQYTLDARLVDVEQHIVKVCSAPLVHISNALVPLTPPPGSHAHLVKNPNSSRSHAFKRCRCCRHMIRTHQASSVAYWVGTRLQLIQSLPTSTRNFSTVLPILTSRVTLYTDANQGDNCLRKGQVTHQRYIYPYSSMKGWTVCST